MAWFPTRLLHALGLRGLAQPAEGAQHSAPVSLGSEAVEISDARALQISAVWSCVRLISETVGCLPLGFFNKTKDGREEADPENYLVALLKRKPNQLMTATEFREAMTTQLVLWGNAYAEIKYSGRGRDERPTSLLPLRPGFMVPHRGKDGQITYHYTDEKNGIHVFAAKSIFHLKGFSAEGIVGWSPLAIARHALGLTVAAEQYSAGTFRNGGRPTGTLNFDTFLTDDQRVTAREMYQNITAGAMNNTNAWVLEGGVKYNAIAIPPDDMQMLQSRTFQLAEIARFFRVPSYLINDSEKSTSWGSGLEQMNLSFLQYCLNPYLRRWESTITDRLMRPSDKRTMVVEHNVEGLLRADSKGRSEFYSKMAQNGLMTRNEIRKKENLPPHEGGDELTVQINLTPVDMLAMATGVTDASET